MEYKDMIRGPRLHNLTDNERLGWRSPIHMPRAAARIFLRITGVRVERLTTIAADDVIAEGGFHNRGQFKDAWNRLNGKRNGGIYSWDKSPWVWVYSFERIDKGLVENG